MTAGEARPVVHVNGVPVALWAGARWRDAVTAWYAAARAALDADTGWVSDAAGEPVDPDGSIVPGAVIGWQWGIGRDPEPVSPRPSTHDEVPDGD